MELNAAHSFIAGLRVLEREAYVPPQAYCLDEGGERIEALDTVGRGAKVTAVVPLFGPLSMHGGRFTSSTLGFSQSIARLDANESVSTIIVHVNSPGGTVTGTTEAANTMRAVRDLGRTRTIAVVEPLMASAASWIATAAGEVVITPSGEAGSIGVVSMYEDASKMLEQMGIKVDVIRTPANKNRFTGMEPLTSEMMETMQARNISAYSQFVDAMARNRGVTKSQVESRFGGGEMLDATEARESGLVDRIATFGEVIDGLGRPGRAKGSRHRAARLKLLEVS